MDVKVTSGSGLQQDIQIGRHRLVSDEPQAFGGADLGPSPYELLAAAIGACTSMTLRMYARAKGWPLQRVITTIRHDKIHARDCADCETKEGRIDRLEREIELEGPLDVVQRGEAGHAPEDPLSHSTSRRKPISVFMSRMSPLAQRDSAPSNEAHSSRAPCSNGEPSPATGCVSACASTSQQTK